MAVKRNKRREGSRGLISSHLATYRNSGWMKSPGPTAWCCLRETWRSPGAKIRVTGDGLLRKNQGDGPSPCIDPRQPFLPKMVKDCSFTTPSGPAPAWKWRSCWMCAGWRSMEGSRSPTWPQGWPTTWPSWWRWSPLPTAGTPQWTSGSLRLEGVCRGAWRGWRANPEESGWSSRQVSFRRWRGAEGRWKFPYLSMRTGHGRAGSLWRVFKSAQRPKTLEKSLHAGFLPPLLAWREEQPKMVIISDVCMDWRLWISHLCSRFSIFIYHRLINDVCTERNPKIIFWERNFAATGTEDKNLKICGIAFWLKPPWEVDTVIDQLLCWRGDPLQKLDFFKKIKSEKMP